jgi:hypothetical protein
MNPSRWDGPVVPSGSSRPRSHSQRVSPSAVRMRYWRENLPRRSRPSATASRTCSRSWGGRGPHASCGRLTRTPPPRSRSVPRSRRRRTPSATPARSDTGRPPPPAPPGASPGGPCPRLAAAAATTPGRVPRPSSFRDDPCRPASPGGSTCSAGRRRCGLPPPPSSAVPRPPLSSRRRRASPVVPRSTRRTLWPSREHPRLRDLRCRRQPDRANRPRRGT